MYSYMFLQAWEMLFIIAPFAYLSLRVDVSALVEGMGIRRSIRSEKHSYVQTLVIKYARELNVRCERDFPTTRIY